jgi:hypothetical protein
MKTVRRIMRNHNLALPYGKHKNRTGKRDLTKPELFISSLDNLEN